MEARIVVLSLSQWEQAALYILISTVILGNFSVIKGSREKISWSKIFALWAFHENF